uniref:ANK_REP_REGION domain-containing protein n=1 Tax=Macrostomum lignano TaxID=282301 RepID=A0A1I8GXX0_9PLAT
KLLQVVDTAAAADAAVESPLAAACRGGHVDTVRLLLLQAGADPDQGGREDGALMSPLAIASMSGRLDLIRLLLDAQANPNLCGSSALLPLSLSARFQSYAAMDELIRAQADVNSIATEDYSHSPLDPNVLSRLYQAQAPLNVDAALALADEEAFTDVNVDALDDAAD